MKIKSLPFLLGAWSTVCFGWVETPDFAIVATIIFALLAITKQVDIL